MNGHSRSTVGYRKPSGGFWPCGHLHQEVNATHTVQRVHFGRSKQKKRRPKFHGDARPTVYSTPNPNRKRKKKIFFILNNKYGGEKTEMTQDGNTTTFFLRVRKKKKKKPGATDEA